MSRPKVADHDKLFKAALRKALMRADGNIRRLDQVVIALIAKACAGDTAAAALIMDRADGRVPQTIGQDDELGPITVVVTGVPQRSIDVTNISHEIKAISSDDKT